MNVKIITVLIIAITLVGLGCASSTDGPENSEDATNPDDSTVPDNDNQEPTTETNNNDTENTEQDNTDDKINSTGTQDVNKEPVLNVASVSTSEDGAKITVRNVGNGTAHNVKCGIIAFGVSNDITYDKYVTGDDLRRIMSDAVAAGVTGDTYEHETNYSYKDTPNLTITYKMSGVDYIGTIEPGESGVGSPMLAHGTVKSDFLTVAWIEGKADEFAIY